MKAFVALTLLNDNLIQQHQITTPLFAGLPEIDMNDTMTQHDLETIIATLGNGVITYLKDMPRTVIVEKSDS